LPKKIGQQQQIMVNRDNNNIRASSVAEFREEEFDFTRRERVKQSETICGQ